MDRIKELINNYARWTNLSKYINRIEYQINDDFTSAIGSTKALLESICKTILDHENTEYDKNDNINKLAKQTINSFKIGNLEQIGLFGNAIVTSIQNIGELRNCIDESSHGKSLLDKNKKIDLITALFLINSAETIACFLIEFYEIEHPRKKGEDEFIFEEMRDFNDYIDNEHGSIEIARIPYATSEALFAIDITAYKDEYRKYLEVVNEQTN